jgi:hypothetical protein
MNEQTHVILSGEAVKAGPVRGPSPDGALRVRGVPRLRLGMTLLLLAGCARTSMTGGWEPQASNTNAEFRGLAAVSESVVWASGTRGRVARTTDGGRTWMVDSVPAAQGLDFRDIYASIERNARVGDGGRSRRAKSGADLSHG